MITGSLIEILFTAGIVFILTLLAVIMSPLGLGFIAFSLIKHFTQKQSLKKISFIFQIAITALTFISGIAIISLMLIANSYYFYGSHFYMIISMIIGVLFTIAIQIGVIVLQRKD